MAEQIITISKGERLQMIVTAKTNGTPIVLDETYSVGAFLALKSDTAQTVDLEPVISGGNIVIDFATDNLPVARHVADVRVTDPSGLSQWSAKFQINLESTITPPPEPPAP